MGEAEAVKRSILYQIENSLCRLHHVDNECDENKKCFNNHQQYPIENGFQEHDKNLNKTESCVNMGEVGGIVFLTVGLGLSLLVHLHHLCLYYQTLFSSKWIFIFHILKFVC